MARFVTRARAVDMLGRQQIAGIPTAISELFKNAHDAYADRVEVDYYRYMSLFVLRDDGLGMTREDFEQRWLTLGTESKLGAHRGLEPPPIDPAKPVRPVLGEKGIGRLAIAVIGPQVLALSRARRGEALHPLVAAFLHWGLFECPGVNLEEIEIPVKEFPEGTVPAAEDVAVMVETFRGNLQRLEARLPDELLVRLSADLDRFQVDPAELDAYLPDMSLTGKGHGTHFIILPTDEILNQDVDPPKDLRKSGASNLTRMLRGFSNTMVPGAPPPAIRAAFREHKTFDHKEDLINSGDFFTPEEFQDADHHIRGTFDAFGQFSGTVSVYGEEHTNYQVSWAGGGRTTYCGPFGLNLAVVQGVPNQSTIPYEDWSRLKQKMDLYGGLYIYRNGIRILPYGNTDYDWVEMEKRRTYSAAYYYFSYRRIFGVVETDTRHNGNLKEKAGREGFIENKAYRQLKDILVNFFTQVAADFFREDSPYGEVYNRERGKFDRLKKIREAQARRASAKRESLNQALEKFFASYDTGEPTEASLALHAFVEKQLKLASDLADKTEAARMILELEGEARKRLSDLEASYRIVKPRGVALTRKMQQDFSQYEAAYAHLRRDVFGPAVEMIDSLVGEAARMARVTLDRRVRVEQTLSHLSSEATRGTRKESVDTRKALETKSQAVVAATRDSLAKLETTLRDVFTEFNRIDLADLPEPAFVSLRARLESRILETGDQEQDFLRYLRTQLEGINVTPGDSGRLDEVEALEERNLALEERADLDLQMVQLGMAIEVINHEFESTVRSIRTNLQQLKLWADTNEDLRVLYQDVRASFEHLDGYLTLFTPLHRRLRRQAITFTGMDIFKFLGDLFQERLRRHETKLEATEPFRLKEITGYPSSFYPVFVNLVDNAIFWLRDQRPPRLVTLDTRLGSITVTDTGPGIALRDMEAVFELGFTRKPGGRGMGLHISRETLQRIGYRLELDQPEPGRGACFEIRPEPTETIDEE